MTERKTEPQLDPERNDEPGDPRYGAVSRTLHWVTFIAVVIMYGAGIVMTSEPLTRFADPLYITHKGLGSVLVLILIGRLAWRLSHPEPAPPPAISPARIRVMRWGHAGLYVLLLVMAVSGYVRTVADGFPIELLDRLGVPPLLPRSPELASAALVTHQVAGYALAVLIAAHVGAAMDDAVLSRRGSWQRMWPPWGA